MKEIRPRLENAVLNHDVMPSMRGLMTAGKALERDNAAIYNCAFLPVDSPKAFDEMLYTLMLGTGVGFSVEADAVKNLPELPSEFYETETTIVFEDSRIGWAKGFREFLSLLFIGQVPKWDTSKLRGAGARLKTFGGRSSGPQPLIDLLEFCILIFKKAAGRKLTTLECHDICCKIADIVVVGGVRRSALISLSDLNDDRMRDAKSGQWWATNAYRRLANNSAIYEETPDAGVFMKEWLSLYESKSGERGIISRKAMRKVIENANKFRTSLDASNRLRDSNHKWGKNPCSEIILRPDEFCNLTSVQIYEDDTRETLHEKIEIATIIGTFQSCLSNFKYLNKKWQRNCEDERLLGISLNGIFDNNLTNGSGVFGIEKLKEFLVSLKSTTIKVNKEWADKLGINQSVAITCVKPEGTSSALNGTSSGIHPAHSPYYIRYVRNDKKDPLVPFMIDSGIPFENDFYDPNNVVCFKFPIKPSSSAIFKDQITAIQHLELWKVYQEFYCEHTPSITVSVKESEWMEVGAWCYNNFDWLSGVSFLPAEESGTVYKQAPFTVCSKEQYEELLAQMPKEIDWSDLSKYELEDSTVNQQTLACVAGNCEI
jgi:ribonucleoside-triphosphate reductase